MVVTARSTQILLHQAHAVEAGRDIRSATGVGNGECAAGAGDALRDNRPIGWRHADRPFEKVILVQHRSEIDLDILSGNDRRCNTKEAGRIGRVGAGEVLLQVAETVAVAVQIRIR